MHARYLGSLFLPVFALVACSSSSNSAVGGGAAAKDAFSASPTASLTKDNGAAAFSKTKAQQEQGSQASAANPLGGAGASTSKAFGSLHLAALEPLGGATLDDCPDVKADKDDGSCACPGGGSIDYSVPNLKALKAGPAPDGEVSMTIVAKGCKEDSGTMDGKLVMVESKKPIIDKSKWGGAPPAQGGADLGVNLLFQADNLAIGDAKAMSFTYLQQDGEMCFKPDAGSDGYYYMCLSLAANPDAFLVVYAKNGRFTCGFDGACTNGKDKVDIGQLTGSPSGDDAGLPADDGGDHDAGP
jgi:hypothetical protein